MTLSKKVDIAIAQLKMYESDMHIIDLFNPYEDNKYKDYVRNYRKKYFNQYYSPMANEKKGIKK